MKQLLLLCLCLFQQFLTLAQQPVVAGRILDDKTGHSLPGVTILQKGTLNGISSDSDGRFTLSLAAGTDSVTLQVSFIGYKSQELRIAAGSNTMVRLLESPATSYCDLCVLPKLAMGLSSGLPYTPVGASVQLFGEGLVDMPITATVNYRTNLSCEHALTATLSLPPLFPRNRLHFRESLVYQRLHIADTHLNFRSYSAIADVGFYRIGNIRVPDLLVGAGYARHHPSGPHDTRPSSGIGYSVGVCGNLLPDSFSLAGYALATRWPGYWQLKGQLMHSFNIYYKFGVEVQTLGSYREVAIMLNRFFY
ncbi:carboxypeptidase-like regulatory domain-containing protein [Hymenobacter tenuis]